MYFTARVTDEAGKDLPDVTVVPALPEPAVAGTPAVPTQQVDGFAAPVRSSRFSELYSDYRGNARAWWEALEDGGGEVVWTTDAAPAKAPTVFDFTAAMSEQPGTAELWVNGHYALTFQTGRFPTRNAGRAAPMSSSTCRRSRQFSPARGDCWCRRRRHCRQPVELRVAHRDGSPFAFFQIRGATTPPKPNSSRSRARRRSPRLPPHRRRPPRPRRAPEGRCARRWRCGATRASSS
jgi:hypothetical protein